LYFNKSSKPGMKKSFATLFIASMLIVNGIYAQGIKYGFDGILNVFYNTTKGKFDTSLYLNFSNTQDTAFIEVVIFTPNNDTLMDETGSSISSIDGSAINGTHFNFLQQNLRFAPGTTIYNGSNRKKFQLNLVKDSIFWGTRYFYVVLTNFVNITAANLWNNQDRLMVIIDYDGSSIGMPKLSFHDYRLYPVPTYDKLYIEGVDSKAFKVYDLMGKMVKEGETMQNSIDVSELTNGIYILKSVTDKGLIVQKFIKQ